MAKACHSSIALPSGVVCASEVDMLLGMADMLPVLAVARATGGLSSVSTRGAKWHTPSYGAFLLFGMAGPLFWQSLEGLKQVVSLMWLAHHVACLAVVLVMAGCLSSVSTRGAKWHALFSGAFLLVAGVGVSIALLVVAPTIQPTSWAVQCYDADDVHDNNLPNLAYMYLIGMLMGQATFIGRLQIFFTH